MSDFDTTHQFNTNWVYELPFGAGKSFAAPSNELAECRHWRLAVGRTGAVDQRLPHHYRDFHEFPDKLVSPVNRDSEPAQSQRPAHLLTKMAIRIYSRTQPPPRATSATLTPANRDSATSFADQATSASTLALSKSWMIRESQNLKFSWDIFNVTNAVRFDVAALPQTTGQFDQPRESSAITAAH